MLEKVLVARYAMATRLLRVHHVAAWEEGEDEATGEASRGGARSGR